MTTRLARPAAEAAIARFNGMVSLSLLARMCRRSNVEPLMSRRAERAPSPQKTVSIEL